MRSYLLIESRSDEESPEVTALRYTAVGLRTAGHQVTLYLLQNAVLCGLGRPTVPELIEAGVEVWIDDFSARNRMLSGLPLPAGSRLGAMPDLVRMLMRPGIIPVWH